MSGWNLQAGKSILFGDFVIGADYSNDNPTIDILMSYFPQLTQRRAGAYRRYQSDIRETATPEGMTKLLVALVEGRLLSSESPRRSREIDHLCSDRVDPTEIRHCHVADS